MITTIDEIDSLEEKWIENRKGFLSELKTEINSTKGTDILDAAKLCAIISE